MPAAFSPFTVSNCTSSGFTSSFLSIILNFVGNIVSMIIADVQTLAYWTGNQIAFLFLSWGASFSSYGVLIPALFVGVVLITLVGIYGVFMFVDGAKDVVGK